MEQLKRRRDRFDRRMYLDGVEISEGLEMAQLIQKISASGLKRNARHEMKRLKT